MKDRIQAIMPPEPVTPGRPGQGPWRFGRQGIAALATLAFATSALAQGTPVPVPTGPSGGGSIYVQPGPSSGAAPVQPDAPDPAAGDARTRPLPTAPAPDVGKDSRQPVRQITSFPEMTRGVGNSQALLGD